MLLSHTFAWNGRCGNVLTGSISNAKKVEFHVVLNVVQSVDLVLKFIECRRFKRQVFKVPPITRNWIAKPIVMGIAILVWIILNANTTFANERQVMSVYQLDPTLKFEKTEYGFQLCYFSSLEYLDQAVGTLSQSFLFSTLGIPVTICCTFPELGLVDRFVKTDLKLVFRKKVIISGFTIVSSLNRPRRIRKTLSRDHRNSS